MEQYVATLDLKTLLDIHRNEIFTSLHCLKPGTIQQFFPEIQTATITINHKFMLGETIGDYPELVDVPVFVPAGGQSALTMPITKGDFCIVLFSDRDISAWLTHVSAIRGRFCFLMLREAKDEIASLAWPENSE